MRSNKAHEEKAGTPKILSMQICNFSLNGNKEVKLHSANKQQALRYYKNIKMRNYPISIRNDLINIQQSKTFYFAKIPIYDYGKREGQT